MFTKQNVLPLFFLEDYIHFFFIHSTTDLVEDNSILPNSWYICYPVVITQYLELYFMMKISIGMHLRGKQLAIPKPGKSDLIFTLE